MAPEGSSTPHRAEPDAGLRPRLESGSESGPVAALAGRTVLIAGDAFEADTLGAMLDAAGARALRVARGGLRAAAAGACGALALVDACHPFDPDGAEEARRAAAEAGLPLVVMRRRPWLPGPGDRWIRVRSPRAAAAALRGAWRRVFVAIGRDRLGPFRGQPGRLFFVRVRGRGGREDGAGAAAGPARLPGLVRARALDAPGPYGAQAEARLFRSLGVQALVARNAGGPAAWPKIAAARRLRLPVVMLEPPPRPTAAVEDPAEALVRLVRLARPDGAAEADAALALARGAA